MFFFLSSGNCKKRTGSLPEALARRDGRRVLSIASCFVTMMQVSAVPVAPETPDVVALHEEAGAPPGSVKPVGGLIAETDPEGYLSLVKGQNDRGKRALALAATKLNHFDSTDAIVTQNIAYLPCCANHDGTGLDFTDVLSNVAMTAALRGKEFSAVSDDIETTATSADKAFEECWKECVANNGCRFFSYTYQANMCPVQTGSTSSSTCRLCRNCISVDDKLRYKEVSGKKTIQNTCDLKTTLATSWQSARFDSGAGLRMMYKAVTDSITDSIMGSSYKCKYATSAFLTERAVCRPS